MILPASRFFLLYFYRLRKVSKESLKTAMQSLSLNGNRCLHCIILPVSMEGTSAVSPLAPLCNFTHTSHHSILRDKESTDFRQPRALRVTQLDQRCEMTEKCGQVTGKNWSGEGLLGPPVLQLDGDILAEYPTGASFVVTVPNRDRKQLPSQC